MFVLLSMVARETWVTVIVTRWRFFVEILSEKAKWIKNLFMIYETWQLTQCSEFLFLKISKQKSRPQ